MKDFNQQFANLITEHFGDADGSARIIPIDSQAVLMKASITILNEKLTEGFRSPEEETLFFRAALPLHISLSAFVTRKRGDSHPHWVSCEAAVLTGGSSLRWTGTKAEAVEIIYELVQVGVLNNGLATIMQVTRWFEQEFQIELGNISKRFQDIRNRRKETTSLAQKMDKALRQYIDQLDEEDLERNNNSRRA